MFIKKKYIVEELNLVKLDSSSYSNLKFADKTKQDSVNKALLDDINTAAKSVDVIATITTAKTGHNRTTKGSNNVSRHMNGTGVDVAILNGKGADGATNATNGSAEFRELGFKMKDALVSMGYVWNTESGKDKAVLWQTNTGGNHFNHLHISNRTGITSSAPSSSDIATSDSNDQENKQTDLNKSTENSSNNSTDGHTDGHTDIHKLFSFGKINNITEEVLRIQDILKKIIK